MRMRLTPLVSPSLEPAGKSGLIQAASVRCCSPPPPILNTSATPNHSCMQNTMNTSHPRTHTRTTAYAYQNLYSRSGRCKACAI